MDDPLRVIVEASGVFLRREALEAGYDDKLIAAMRRGHHWHRVRQGAYTFADLWAEQSSEQRHLTLARAVLRTTPGPVALSHTTALLALGVDLWGVDLSRAHVTRLDTGAGRLERDVVHHTGRLTSSDLVSADGLPCVAPARAVLETATISRLEAALVASDSALHRDLCSEQDLREVFARLGHWRGSQKIHVLLRHTSPDAESVGETRSRYLIWRHHLPRPVLQFPVYDHGALVGLSDFAWPDHRLLGEFDGRMKYGRLLAPGESPGDAVWREKQREDRIRSLTGYAMARWTWDSLARPEALATWLREMMRRAA